MGMIFVVIVMAAAMLWLGLMGHERAKAGGSEAGGNLVLPAVIAPLFGLAMFLLVGVVGGEFWGLLAAVVVYFGILHYFLLDALRRENRAGRKKIEELERKIDQLAEVLVEVQAEE